MARRFFPTVPPDEAEAYAYPRPLSEPFWVLYNEPLRDFFAAASLLRRTLLDLALVGEAAKKTVREPNDAPPLDHVLYTLERLIGPVTPTIVDDGGLRQRWVFSSLIASFAMMVLQDLLAGHRPLVCKRCQTVFLSRAYQAEYCSPRCQNQAQQERHRERKAEALRLACDVGLDAETISRALNADIAAVRRWTNLKGKGSA